MKDTYDEKRFSEMFDEIRTKNGKPRNLETTLYSVRNIDGEHFNECSILYFTYKLLAIDKQIPFILQ
jgi:hypothetical protein